ncbi:MAG: uroporphyrinogen-III synthase [Woeseia sp.]
MTEAQLGGDGVLVTRPAHLAHELADAVTAAGGRVIAFPVIDIVPEDPTVVAGTLARLAPPDIVIFISRNAVLHGLGTLGRNRVAIAAIGPATRDALVAAGRQVDIEPAGGFASEDLLAEPALANVGGKRIRIIRGKGGRELLAATLERRGAAVDYLDVYRREPHCFSRDELAKLARRWQAGEVRFVTAMSVASLDNLLRLLPAACLENLAAAQLVTPSTRVIQTALERIPSVPALLAKSPRATHMVEAMVAGRRPRMDDAHER